MNRIFYTTINKKISYEIEKIKGSRFIGAAIPTDNKEQAEEIINDFNKKYFDANHNCYAYKIGMNNNIITRFSDDGEPSGTAGKPIMNVINSSGLTDLIIIVTRYFGGTKLGTGGLIKAYSQCAKEVLEKTETKIIEIMSELKLKYEYDQINLFKQMQDKYSFKIINEEFLNNVSSLISINKGFTETFKSDIFDKSNGTIKAGE